MTNNSLELTLSPRDEIARESEKRLTWEIVLETFTLLCVILVALVGNSLTCAAVYRNQRLRTAPNYYVVTLAISDILMAILLATFGVAVIIEGRWLFGSVACEVLGFLPILLATFSIYIMMLIAVNRYFTVLHRAIHKKYFTLRNTVLSILAAWLLSWNFPLSYSLAGNPYEFHTGKLICAFNPRSLTVYHAVICSLTNVAVPYSIIVVAYFSIGKEVKSHNKRLHRSGRNPGGIPAEEVRITRMLFAIILAFTVCWFVFLVIEVLGLIMGEYALPRPVYACYTQVIASSYAINPIVYAAMNKYYRGEFKLILENLRPSFHCGVTRCIPRKCQNAEISSVTLADLNSVQGASSGC